ncbi:MAG: sodium:alanine symporter family protein [Candidatus Riflebacteria bacterium HGW-Riflebacteria-2]|nr:MAG: sodium:alanine symporter family protein [Candidatus Riflebacteria bacterium HGW-Riflebacteria-2]
MFMIVGTGVWLTFKMRLVQIRFFAHAWSLISGKWENPEDKGEITHFQALSTALAATVGTGNIAGVATALVSGGPGAVFWMWVSAFIGMCTKFTSCLLAMKYRTIDSDGEVAGGPMYYLRDGLKMPKLGMLFAIFAFVASFGIGNMVQANSVAGPLHNYLTEAGLVSASTGEGFNMVRLVIGIVIAIIVGIVILGGIKRIASFADKIVPFMAFGYVAASLYILFVQRENLIPAIKMIFGSAFGLQEAAGGVLGFGVAQAMRWGIARGLFSNEAGLGSAPIAHAAAKTSEPVREGMVALLEPFIDTIVICTMTALVIITSGYFNPAEASLFAGLKGAELTAAAFRHNVPWGHHVVSFGLIFFTFSTMIGWSYYGDRSVRYMFDENPKRAKKAVFIYRLVYVLLIPVGAAVPLELIWNLSDIANGLMAFPNLIALLALSGVVSAMLRDYEARYPRMHPLR